MKNTITWKRLIAIALTVLMALMFGVCAYADAEEPTSVADVEMSSDQELFPASSAPEAEPAADNNDQSKGKPLDEDTLNMLIEAGIVTIIEGEPYMLDPEGEYVRVSDGRDSIDPDMTPPPEIPAPAPAPAPEPEPGTIDKDDIDDGEDSMNDGEDNKSDDEDNKSVGENNKDGSDVKKDNSNSGAASPSGAKRTSPQTGDANRALLWAALFLLCGVTVTLLGKKKRIDR